MINRRKFEVENAAVYFWKERLGTPTTLIFLCKPARSVDLQISQPSFLASSAASIIPVRSKDTDGKIET